MKIGKKKLIERMSNQLGMSKTETEVLFEDIFIVITNTLIDGFTVSIPRFGKFEISITGERKARNPKTGESIQVQKKRKIKFKPSNMLKNIINKNLENDF